MSPLRPSHRMTMALALLLVTQLALAVPIAGLAPPVDGEEIGLWIIDSPPPSDLTVDATLANVPTPEQMMAATLIDGVPRSEWTYGCSATSAGMLFGFYDRTGWANMYDGDVPLAMGDSHPLIATQDHIDDYWISYNSTGPDPWVSGGGSEHTWADCTADYLGTNQWKWDYNDPDPSPPGDPIDANIDGGTSVWSYTSSPTKLFDYVPLASYGLPQTAFTHGLRLFAESRGYSVATDDQGRSLNYTQRVDARVAGGFSFDDYMNEINAKRPVVIHVTGHTMLGVGYDPSGNTVYLHDTWDHNLHSMTWGGSYSGMQMQTVTVLQLNAVPEPGTVVLFALGLLAGGGVLRRRKRS